MDTTLLEGGNNRHPPACGEDHKTKDNQVNASSASPEGGDWRRNPGEDGHNKDISQFTQLHETEQGKKGLGNS